MNAYSHSRPSVAERLAKGKARGLGCADGAAREAGGDAAVLRELVDALEDERPVVVARAANALKKVGASAPGALQPFARAILRAAMDCAVLEARWNLAQVIGGLELKGRERALAVELMLEALTQPSALLRTFALQTLVDLSRSDPRLRRRVRPLVEQALEQGTAAMRARARKLLPLLDAMRG